ncbi:hypothetical protein AGMMS50262_07460 [Bacteroidia bacterium]|nr:hypothetical protein AGMMS50262_07460 [Bacteroidia bacterium]
MMLFKQIEMLNRLHKFIDQSCTGVPVIFAKKLGISERHLHAVIEEMRDLGAPIDYSRRNRTYFYRKPFEMKISCTFRCISPQEQENIFAGSILTFSFTAFFVQ